MNDTTINAYSRFAIYAQAVDAPITLNNMNITNDYGGGILAEYSQPITLNNLTVSAGNQDAYEWINTALAAAQGANVEINGGTYTGNNAVLILSSGANVTINGGTFNGNIGFASDVSESVKENSSLVINGGTFTVDPSDYVNTDTHTVTDNGDDTWSVQEKSAETITLTYTVVEPADWDGALARRDETSVTLKVDGDYTADDLEWSLPDSGGADCISAEGIVEHEDGSATITHVGSICGGGGGTVRVSLTSDLSVYLDINIGCDT